MGGRAPAVRNETAVGAVNVADAIDVDDAAGDGAGIARKRRSTAAEKPSVVVVRLEVLVMAELFLSFDGEVMLALARVVIVFTFAAELALPVGPVFALLLSGVVRPSTAAAAVDAEATRRALAVALLDFVRALTYAGKRRAAASTAAKRMTLCRSWSSEATFPSASAEKTARFTCDTQHTLHLRSLLFFQ